MRSFTRCFCFLGAALLLFCLLPLTDASYPPSAAALNEDAVIDGDWKYVVKEGAAEIIDYLGKSSDVTVPAKLGGYDVKSFFCDLQTNTTLKKLSFEEGIETISDYACRNSPALSEVRLPGSLRVIGYEAFARCGGIKDVSIPDGVVAVRDRAFEDTAFYKDGSNWENGMLYCGAYLLDARPEPGTTAKIKEGTRVIADHAFWGFTKMTEAELPSTLVIIGEQSFAMCGLLSVSIPESVTEIGGSAFNGCSALETVSFSGNSQLKTIGKYAFGDCRLLDHLYLPDGLRSIGEQAFCGCGFLSDIRLPEGITHIGRSSFDGTRAAQNNPECLYVSGYLVKFDARYVSALKITDGTVMICSCAFYYFQRPISLHIPKSVRTIEPDAFTGTHYYIREITYEGGEAEWKELAGSAFDGCKDLKVTFNVKEGRGQHIHTFPDWTYEKATCQKEGRQYRVCESCGYEDSRTLPVTDHLFDENNVCTMCGFVLEDIVIDETPVDETPVDESPARSVKLDFQNGSWNVSGKAVTARIGGRKAEGVIDVKAPDAILLEGLDGDSMLVRVYAEDGFSVVLVPNGDGEVSLERHEPEDAVLPGKLSIVVEEKKNEDHSGEHGGEHEGEHGEGPGRRAFRLDLASGEWEANGKKVVAFMDGKRIDGAVSLEENDAILLEGLDGDSMLVRVYAEDGFSVVLVPNGDGEVSLGRHEPEDAFLPDGLSMVVEEKKNEDHSGEHGGEHEGEHGEDPVSRRFPVDMTDGSWNVLGKTVKAFINGVRAEGVTELEESDAILLEGLDRDSMRVRVYGDNGFSVVLVPNGDGEVSLGRRESVDSVLPGEGSLTFIVESSPGDEPDLPGGPDAPATPEQRPLPIAAIIAACAGVPLLAAVFFIVRKKIRR